MIPSGVEIFVSLDPVDLRWGFDRLAGLAEERVGRKPRSGALLPGDVRRARASIVRGREPDARRRAAQPRAQFPHPTLRSAPPHAHLHPLVGRRRRLHRAVLVVRTSRRGPLRVD